MSHTFAPFADLANIETTPAMATNVAMAERVGSGLAGAVMVSYGIARRDLTGVIVGLLGGLLIARGTTGQCQLYRHLGVDTTGASDGHGVPSGAGVRVERSIEVRRSPMELYHFWHQLSDLPLVMPHLKSVTVDGARSHWIVSGPAGYDLRWDAEFINEEPGQLLAWQSLPGADVQSAGSVHFESLEEGQATRVKVALMYLPPGGKAGALAAHIFGTAPEQQLDEDLVRFKEKMESIS